MKATDKGHFELFWNGQLEGVFDSKLEVSEYLDCTVREVNILINADYDETEDQVYQYSALDEENCDLNAYWIIQKFSDEEFQLDIEEFKNSGKLKVA